MGVVTTDSVIVGPQADAGNEPQTQTVHAIVDTGATLSVLPEKVLNARDVPRLAQVAIRLGDDRRILRDVGNVQLRVQAQAVWSRVVFGQPDDPKVVGLTVLEQLGLTDDPAARRLVPTDFLLL